MADDNIDVDVLSIDELKAKLESLNLAITRSRSVLRERLLGALTPEQEDENLTCEIINAMKKADLVQRLASLSLKTTGNKKELQNRLKAALDLTEDNEDDDHDGEDDGEHDDEEDEVEVNNGTQRHPRNRRVLQPTLTYKDVEDALETFSGEGTQNFQRWLLNFEETATLCAWSDMQKVIYAKRLLRGATKLFVKFESSSSSWKKLKKSLADEFSMTTNSKEVHRQLSMVKKKFDESYQEYIYRVLEIASHSEIELEAKIQYIIDGVPGDEASKSIL